MKKLKLMIVDDSFVIRSIIAEAHNSESYELVAIARNGLEAVEKYRQTKPNIVTMDLTMPHMDGLECIDNLIALDPDIQIVVISALNDQATGIKALKKGASGFVTKPFSNASVCEAIDTVAELI